jgi:translation initiation factor 3 subunit L
MADTISDQMRATITGFGEAVRSQNLSQIASFYENGGLKLADKSKQVEWPSVETVATIVSDKAFNLLYKEMFYRHVMANPKAHQMITLEQRQSAFQTYIELFDYLLNRSDSPNLELPPGWVWDMVDEFIYQFQEFHTYRGNRLRSGKGGDEVALKNSGAVWNIHTVLKYLHAFCDKSEVLAVLQRELNGTGSEEMSSVFPGLPLYRLFGTYSLIGLLRVHCLIGDYYSALKSVSLLQPWSKSERYVAPKITLYYYTGFAYMMMRRYADAIRMFSHILHWLSRSKSSGFQKSYQTDDTNKKNDQMYALLAILITFCPQRLDEYVGTTLRDTYAEKMAQMGRGDLAIVEDLFSYGGPKWVSPISEGDDLPNANPEMLKLQTKLFINEIRQQMLLPTIRSSLKLYTTIDLSKLATLISTEKNKVDEAALSKALLSYTHKTRGVVSSSSQSTLDGTLTSFSDVTFYFDNEMIHIFDAKPPRRFGEYFTRKIIKLEDLILDLTKEQS